MVMVDDASARMFGYLPKVNQHIVSKGATIPNYLLSQPICAPSRATILRGQYSQNTGIIANKFDDHSALWHFRQNGCEASNIATWLQGAGYRTGLVGKYMNGYGEDDLSPVPGWYKPTGWDYFFAVGGDAGEAYDYDAFDNGTVVHYGNNPLTDYLTNVIRGKAVDFLEDALEGEDPPPFLLIVTPKAPHHPANPHVDYQSDYAGVTYPKGAQNPSFDEADVTDKPDWIQAEPRLSGIDKFQIDYFYRRKLQCMKSVDDLVDTLVTTIGEKMNNTYFIFCSDNGFHHGEHRLGHHPDFGGKNTPYEEDIRVPLYIRGPGIPEQSTVPQLVGNVDIAPTFCAMASVTPNQDALDGRSFLPLVQGQTVPWRNYYLLTRGKGEEFAGFRAADFMFTEFDRVQDGVQGEYYDLRSGQEGDLPEEDNLYAGFNQDRLDPLQARLRDLRNCEGESCRTADV